MRKIFKDEELQHEFDLKGFVKLPFLDPSEVAELKTFYSQLHGDSFEGFHCSMFHTSYDYKKNISDKLVEIGNARIGRFLNDFYTLYGNFMVKEPGEASEFSLHQDWAYVDESKYASMAIWFPLIDLDEGNGCLHFVEGSHNIPNLKRGPGLHFPYTELTPRIMEEYLTPVPMKAGEAVLWDHKMLHYSTPNMGNESRVSGTMILIPKEAEVIHYYRDDSYAHELVDTYKVDEDFFMNYEVGKKPQAHLLDSSTYHFDEVDESKLKEARIDLEPKKEPNMVQKLISTISNVFTNN